MITNRRIVILSILFIPITFVSYYFHELGHWIIGELLGNDMGYSLDGVWPKAVYYIDNLHGLYVGIGGPAFSILQAFIFMIIIEKYRYIYAYPFIFIPLLMRFFSITFGGFNKQDEAGISATLSLGTYTIAIIVLLILFLIVWRASYKLKIGFKHIGLFTLISMVSILIVIGTSELIK